MNKCLKPIWLMSQLTTQIESKTQLNQTCYVKGMTASLQATDEGFTAKNLRPFFFFPQTILMLAIRAAVNSQGADITVPQCPGAFTQTPTQDVGSGPPRRQNGCFIP